MDHPMGADGLAWADYRPADTDQACGNCAFFNAPGFCHMFDINVDPAFTCDEWEPFNPPETPTVNQLDDERAVDGDPEYRFAVAPITHVEVRDPTANPDDTWTMSGYAAVFNRSTVLYDGNFLVRSEEIDPGFFDPIFRDQPLSQPDGVVHFNYGHDMLSSVAASDVPAGQPGSLVLRSDAHGLHFLAKVPRDDPDGVRMAAKMRSGVLKQASFAFTIAEKQTSQRELEDGRMEERDRLLRAGRLYDVCATPQGAYPQTVSQLRSMAAALGQPTPVGAQHISAATVAGVSNVSPSGGVSGAAKRKFEAQIMRDELTRKYRK